MRSELRGRLLPPEVINQLIAESEEEQKSSDADSVAEEIKWLHKEIAGKIRKSLKMAIRIGELLQQKKDELGHGKWGLWLKKNLEFTDRTARSYMRVYKNREKLKTENVSDLTPAYKLLTKSSVGQAKDSKSEPVKNLDYHKSRFIKIANSMRTTMERLIDQFEESKVVGVPDAELLETIEMLYAEVSKLRHKVVPDDGE